MLEREIKKYLVTRCKEMDIYHRKFVSPGNVAVPDWILINNGKVLFLELKGTGKFPTAAQDRELKRISDSGAFACFASSFDEIDCVLSYLREEWYDGDHGIQTT